MSDISELDDALSAALQALSAAQATLRKSLPGRSIDALQKAHLGDDPRASRGGAMKRAQSAMDDLDNRLARLEAARDAKPAQYAITGGAQS